jgi:hypothetical protein
MQMCIYKVYIYFILFYKFYLFIILTYKNIKFIWCIFQWDVEVLYTKG